MSGIRICIDRGGTFTDCIAFVPDHIHPPNEPKPTEKFRPIVVKLLSVDPTNYKDAPREGIRRILEIATGIPHPRNKPVDTSKLELVRMGTTVATNALLERKGERTLFITTKGFKDLLKIGTQARSNLFDLSISKLDVLYEDVLEVDERVTLVGYSVVPSGMNVTIPDGDKSYVKGITGEWVKIIQRPNLKPLEASLQKVLARGIVSVAICLMHSFTFPDHEIEIGNFCKSLGFKNVTLSSKTIPMIKIVPRGTSTTADAYLTPSIKTYLESFFAGFDQGMRSDFKGKKAVNVEFMQSDGGLVDAHFFNGFKAILSGPAGGVVGYATTSWEKGGQAVIGFDMGGTSTDVSRFGGKFEHVFETTTAGITIQAPQLDINTVAAGGGSRLFFRNGMFVVGPESASADPGPACYRKGGPLTITDANLLLGRLDAEYFPKIFGKSEKEPLDGDFTRKEFHVLAEEINLFLQERNMKSMSLNEVAYGFIKVANEAMCRPIRALTQGKGFNASDHILSCFGGAGGQHAFAIARALGIKTILVHRYASILSAYGQALADVVNEVQEPSASVLTEGNMNDLKESCSRLTRRCLEELKTKGFPEENIKAEVYLNLRYHGTDTAIMTLKPSALNDWDFKKIFLANYQQEFGFTLPNRDIIVDDIRVRCICKSIATGSHVKWTAVHQEVKSLQRKAVGKPHHVHSVYWGSTGRIETKVFLLNELQVGATITGPAIIIDKTSTIAVEPDCSALITSEHIVGFVGERQAQKKEGKIECDPILLSVFGHRFMSIAEQMGRTLQKTSISTNIKERLDFSCALFGPDGGLVANAPHIPVHLGSMQEAVRWQLNHTKIKEGDVIMSNHPMAGGSHLPDITVITPVFDKGKIVFFVASRGHHADIGGIRAGSMPPDSKELYQEGAAVKSFFLVKNGVFDEVGVTKLLVEEPAKYENCRGTRTLKDNISDLKAQVAANHRGIQLVTALIGEYGLPVVQAYMAFIQDNAHQAVSDLLRQTSENLGSFLTATDYMDDGSSINLTIKIDQENGTANFDFTGTGNEVYANTNAPVSVTYSAIIYSLRCLVNLDIPLNQGALKPISINIPQGCLLNPSENAAVVGGNVLTSQRLCDVIFKAFQACAASQGCCNNLTFGKDSTASEDGFGYYETIGGGSGAGPTWIGCSGVHTHMTNTRITDPEILERRYPTILREFSLRQNSGGEGLNPGGNGIVREIEFLEKLQVSILSERRVFAPYGLHGGLPGKKGANTLMRKTKSGYRMVNIGGKNAVMANVGDRLRIETPGGGGWGNPSGVKRKLQQSETLPIKLAGGSTQKFIDLQHSV